MKNDPTQMRRCIARNGACRFFRLKSGKRETSRVDDKARQAELERTEGAASKEVPPIVMHAAAITIQYLCLVG